ncbi:MAG TPA: sugar phosphate isomerase/epimerase [Bryobacteraceae bacterium]|jgi:sugar phosphate isomerase/epimerase|nr:sugar phosphate isomerase/epimerase [Bryobacteraceae bacterium]
MLLSRRTALLAPLAQVVTPTHAASPKMVLSLHQNTSVAAGYRKSLEGWAKAGVKNVELTDRLLDEFLKTDDLAAARRVVTDLGLTPVSCASVLPDFWIPNPNRAAALETWKKRCEQFSSFGLTKIYCPAVTSRKVTMEDYKGAVDCIREGGEAAKQFKMTAMIEFARNSSFISTLTTSLDLIRKAAHPNVQPMLDCYHFWSGLSKFEDLDLLHPGELAHVHFQDVPDVPRELLDNTTRLIPGDGVSPLVRILRKLAEKGYSGALSVELFLPEFTQGDPAEVAARIREKAEGVMRQAKVA